MFKILLLLFLGWLAFRMIRAGRTVVGIMNGVRQAMDQASGPAHQAGAPAQTRQRHAAGEPPGKVTIHRKASPHASDRSLEAEDVRFEDL